MVLASTSSSRLQSFWLDCRADVLAGTLSHAKALQLVQLAAEAGRWDRLRRWLPPLLIAGVGLGERSGSAVAIAAWFRNQQRPVEAMLCLEVVPWDQVDAHAWLLRGAVEHALDRFPEAQLSLARAITEHSIQGTVAYHLGELHRSLAQFDQAAGWYLASLAIDPSHRASHDCLQYTRFSVALLPRVIRDYQHLVEQVPKQALPRQLLAHYLLQSGRRAEALLACRQASRLELGSLTAQLAPEDTPAIPPEFVIAGVPKGGTTSLLHCLSHHPSLWCHPRKELHFFDEAFSLGEAWYMAQFPLFLSELGILRGEATPNYFNHPLVPERIASLTPQLRCIVLLRDPIDRAISWIQHLRRFEGLKGDVETLLRHEFKCLEAVNDEARMRLEVFGTGALQGSCYDTPYKRWMQHIPARQLLLVKSERLFQQPGQQLAVVLNFLGLDQDVTKLLSAWRPINVNPAPVEIISAGLRSDLERFFAMHSHLYSDIDL